MLWLARNRPEIGDVSPPQHPKRLMLGYHQWPRVPSGTEDPANVGRGLTWETWELCRISPRYTWIYLFSETKNMEKPWRDGQHQETREPLRRRNWRMRMREKSKNKPEKNRNKHETSWDHLQPRFPRGFDPLCWNKHGAATFQTTQQLSWERLSGQAPFSRRYGWKQKAWNKAKTWCQLEANNLLLSFTRKMWAYYSSQNPGGSLENVGSIRKRAAVACSLPHLNSKIGTFRLCPLGKCYSPESQQGHLSSIRNPKRHSME